MKRRILAWLVLLCASSCLFAGVPALVAIRNARVVTVSGPTLDKGTVVIRDGLIEAVGANVPVPAGAWEIDGSGLTVYPGLIDAVSTLGIPQAAAVTTVTSTTRRTSSTPATPALTTTTQPAAPPSRGPEDRPQTQSWLRAADQVSLSDSRLDAARTAGFTTAMTFPKTGLVAGNGAAINLGGERPGDMVISPGIGLYLTTGGSAGGEVSRSFPGALFGVMAYYRQLWIDAAYYKMQLARYEKNPSGKQRPRYDRALEGVLAAPRALLPANNAVQIDRMLRFGKDLDTPFLLYGLQDGYLVADQIKQSGVPVIVNLRWPTRSRDADPEMLDSLRDLEAREKAPSTPAALAKAGVKFAFSADGVDTPRAAIQAVKKAIDSGLTKEQALSALTLSAAEIYGLNDRLGSLDKGKIANLLVVKGDLFDDRPQVQMIFVDGVKYDPAPETPAGPGRNSTATPTTEDDTN